MNPRVYFIMPMSRPGNLTAIFQFYYNQLEDHPFEIRWLIGQQGKEPDPKGVLKTNEMINLVPDGAWFFCVADDTLCHAALLKRLAEIIKDDKIGAVVFAGRRNAENEVLQAVPERMTPGGVCGSQVCWNKSFIGSERFDFESHAERADGALINKLYYKDPSRFALIDEPLTYYGSLEW